MEGLSLSRHSNFFDTVQKEVAIESSDIITASTSKLAINHSSTSVGFNKVNLSFSFDNYEENTFTPDQTLSWMKEVCPRNGDYQLDVFTCNFEEGALRADCSDLERPNTNFHGFLKTKIVD